jgi:hypothetical protein
MIYLDRGASQLMAVRLSVEDGELVPELARAMFDYPRSYSAWFDVTGEPLRILTDEPLLLESATQPPPTVIVNWFEELERKIPEL